VYASIGVAASRWGWPSSNNSDTKVASMLSKCTC
jgi:hypothetical protein